MTTRLVPSSRGQVIQARAVVGVLGLSANWVEASRPAGMTLGGHRLLAPDGSGGVVYADPSDTTGGLVLGLSLAAAPAGENVRILTAGRVQDAGIVLTPGLPVFLGPSGTLTHDAPSSGWLVCVGVSGTSDELFLNIGPAIWRG